MNAVALIHRLHHHLNWVDRNLLEAAEKVSAEQLHQPGQRLRPSARPSQGNNLSVPKRDQRLDVEERAKQRPRLADPFAKARQRIRRPALAHSEAQPHTTRPSRIVAETPRTIGTPPNPVNAAPPKGIRRFAAAEHARPSTCARTDRHRSRSARSPRGGTGDPDLPERNHFRFSRSRKARRTPAFPSCSLTAVTARS